MNHLFLQKVTADIFLNPRNIQNYAGRGVGRRVSLKSQVYLIIIEK